MQPAPLSILVSNVPFEFNLRRSTARRGHDDLLPWHHRLPAGVDGGQAVRARWGERKNVPQVHACVHSMTLWLWRKLYKLHPVHPQLENPPGFPANLEPIKCRKPGFHKVCAFKRCIQSTHSLKPAGFKPRAYKVKIRFQTLLSNASCTAT
jgi:hypothetical protein